MSPFARLVRYFPAKRPNYSNSFSVLHQRQNSTAPSHHLFDEIPPRDISSINSLLASYFRNGDPLTSWDLFLNTHRTRSDLNSYTFMPVLGACSALPKPVRGQLVHALMIKSGTDIETVTKTALMDMYSKYGRLDDSVCVFEEMGLKDVVTWNAMLMAFLRHGFPRQAFSVFEEMRKEKVEFSEFTLCSVLKACTSLNACEQGKQVHALVIVMGRDLVVLGTALVDFYSSVGCIDEAIRIYLDLNVRKDDIMRNSLISGCIRNQKYDVAMSVMSCLKPNTVALTSALAACSDNSDLWIGKQIHAVAVRQGFTTDTQLCNALLNMYAKCGKILDAHSVFERINPRDVVSWTTMIDAYGSHGNGVEALQLFDKIGKERNGVVPNSVTYLAVLSACGHSGLVDQGRESFILFQNKYGVVPGPEHHACFIDILGRAGQIEEVWSLYHDMNKKNIKPTDAVWAALLNACRINQDVTRGEFAAKNLLELDASKPANYVALSNFYAAIDRWDSVDDLRNIMKMKGIGKVAGSSWVTLPNGYKNSEGLVSMST